MDSKRKTKTKASALLLASTMLIGLLAGCSGTKNVETVAPVDKGTESTTPTTKTEDITPMTLSLFSADPSPNWTGMKDETGKIITEKTGITLDAEFAVGDPQQKVGLIAASGEYPDLISAKNDISKLVDAGAMLDLTDLIEEHAPNIKKVLGEYTKRARYSDDDKAIYAIPSYAGVDNQSLRATGGFELQHRAVKEAGYPEIKTVQDYENVIKSYIDKHPTDENGNKNIGLTLNADDWYMYITVTNPAFYTTGSSDDGEYAIDIDTQEVTYHYKRPAEKEYFRWLNHMNDIGLLDPESFVQKYDQYKAKIATGRVIGMIDQDWAYGDAEKALKTANKLDQGYGHYPVTLSSEYKETSFWPTGFMAGYGIGISVDCKDPVRAIKFLDYLASDEGQVLLNWGVEGKDYKIEDGKRVIPADVASRKINDATNFTKETGIGLYNNLSVHYGDGVKDSTDNYYTTSFPEQIVADYNAVEKETLAAYKVTTWRELFPKDDEFKVKPWGAAWNIAIPGDSEVLILDNKLRDITWKRIPEAILAKPDNFDKVWESYMQDLDKAGVDKAETLREELVKQRVKLWND
ncbi:ABC transporter substrate-binding protein [Paenibacillus antarcticus]|uniref:ABC transporter substrate-binding protein n=1 Tax=Paenibacillus antarcticus TaxID=253703 RepID=A0A162Q0M9_9BACL|nr:ABC transporter substrate-binding protein [Paenibacillus antarcticus]OAB41070.1 ABC transporter substrate-binding protein [Paenibacillus antarcticus]